MGSFLKDISELGIYILFLAICKQLKSSSIVYIKLMGKNVFIQSYIF